MRVNCWLAGLVALALTGCGAQPPAGVTTQDAPLVAEEPDTAPGRIWFEVLGVAHDAEGFGAGEITVVPDEAALVELWIGNGFAGAAPAVPFDEQIVLVYARAEDLCPDDLLEARLEAGRLEGTWQPPPGMCAAPLITTAHAVAFHRGSLPRSFAAVLEARPHLHGVVEVSVELPPYDGPPAPAAPPPPLMMTDAEVDAVFAGHPLRRCAEMPAPTAPPGHAELAALHAATGPLIGRERGPHVLYAGSSDHLFVNLLDPTREDLDVLAALVDPATTCVEVSRSGLPRDA